MKKDFVRTKVLMLIIILLVSSFGLYVTGSYTFDNQGMDLNLPEAKSPRKTTWDPPAYEVTSRATGPQSGSWVLNEGDPTFGYFLGTVDSTNFKQDHSTLDNYFVANDLTTSNAKDKPVFPGSVDVVYDLTVESRKVRDDDGSNGDELLYQTRVMVDLNDVEIRDELDWSWSTSSSPFYEKAGSEPNIVDTGSDAWINNNLTVNRVPADQYAGWEYDHDGNARYMVGENNTIAQEDYVTGTGGSGSLSSVWTAEAYNNTTPDDYVDNQMDTMLNATGDMSVNPPEYKDLIRIDTGPKVFEGFVLDVMPDADPGVYRFKVDVEFNKQTYAPFPDDGMEQGIMPGNLHTTDALGYFEPYFWVPWNVTDNTPVDNLTQYNRDRTYGDVQFKKVATYYPSGGGEYDVDELDGKSSWEPIADDSTDVGPFSRVTPLAYKDYDGDDVDSSADAFDMYNYAWRQNPSDTPVPGTETNQFVAKWGANYHLDTGDDVTLTQPNGLPIGDHDYSFLSGGADDANGTWQSSSLAKANYEAAKGSGSFPPNSNNLNGDAHAGFEDHIVTEPVTETYWVQIKVFSATESNYKKLQNQQTGLVIDPSGSSDTYVTDGDKFEEFTVSISNGEFAHYAPAYEVNYTNIIATLDITPYQEYFTVHGGGIARVQFMTDNPRELKFRISSNPQTPPGYYYFKLNWTYTKIYYFESPSNDPRNDVMIDAAEVTMMQFYVEFSPDLFVKDAKPAMPGMRALNPKFTMDTGTNKAIINFTIENSGNVDLIGDAQYTDNPTYYDGKFGDLGMYVVGVELLGSEFNEEDDNTLGPFLDIDPIIITEILVGDSMVVNVPVTVNSNWDNPPGIYRIHLNFRGFYFDPGDFTPSSGFIYTEIRWTPVDGSEDQSFSYRDTNGDGTITVADEADETDGIFADVEIVQFNPASRELKIKSFMIGGVTSGTVIQGTTSATIDIEFENPTGHDMVDVEVMLAIGGTWFSVFSHYDIDEDGISDSVLSARTPLLAMGETFNVTFILNGIDRLTPTGIHHLPINYMYDFEELPGHMSTYGIVWMDSGGRFRGYIDEDGNGVKDAGDDNELVMDYNYDGGYLAVDVVEDNFLDVIAVQNTGAGQTLDLGLKVRNINLRIDLTSREYVDYTQINAFLETTAPNPRDNFQPVAVLQNPITLDDQDIKGVFVNPGDDRLDAGDSNSIIFNVNLNESTAIELGGVYTFNMVLVATNDDTNTRTTYTIPVNIGVLPVDPILVFEDDSFEIDGKIKPGSEFDLEITLVNVGDDAAKEIYVTLSNEWYMDDPFFLVDAFVTSVSAIEEQDYSQNCIDCDTDSSTFKRVPNSTSLSDLGIDHTVDIVDAERVLMSPAAQVSRLYIEEIGPGEQWTVTFHMQADTHMAEGKSYEEVIILEFRDSYGNFYDWSRGPPYTMDQAYAITLVTDGNDEWQDPDSVEELKDTHAQEVRGLQAWLIVAVIFAIIFFILFLYMYRRREAAGDEEPEEEYVPPPSEEEMEEDEDVVPPAEEAEDGEDEEEDWGASEDEEEDKPEDDSEEAEEDWGGSDEEGEKKEETEEEEWTSPASEEEEEEEWSLDKEE